MGPMYGCPENFRQSLSTPTATFAEIFKFLLHYLILHFNTTADLQAYDAAVLLFRANTLCSPSRSPKLNFLAHRI